jgi:hypothetical protein
MVWFCNQQSIICSFSDLSTLIFQFFSDRAGTPEVPVSEPEQLLLVIEEFR